MGSTPRHQRRCGSRLRSRPLARLVAGGGRFAGGAIADFGGYSNSTDDSPMYHTLTSNNMQTTYSWPDHLPAPLPVTGRPQAVHQFNETATVLTGSSPLSPTLGGNPENLAFRDVAVPAGG
jgi:hypothetical protein